MTHPSDREVERYTDHYFNRTKQVIGRFGDARVTYAIFMRRPVVFAPRLALQWLEELGHSRNTSVDLDLLDRFEFRPMEPPAATATVGSVPAPPAPPTPPVPPAAPQPRRPPPPVVVDVNALVGAALAAAETGVTTADAERIRAEVARKLDEAQLKMMAVRATREAAMRAAETMPKANMSGRQLEVPVQVEGDGRGPPRLGERA